MVAPMIVHARSCKAAARVDEAVDTSAGPLVPADIECSKFREELQLAVGKIVMNPQRHCAPVHASRMAISKPRYHHRCHSAHTTLGIEAIPDMAPIVPLVRCAAQSSLIPQGIHRRCAVGGPDSKPAEGRLKRIEQLQAEPATRRDGKVRLLRDIWDAIEIRDFAVQEVTHKERGRQTNAAQVFKTADGFWLAHFRDSYRAI